MNGYELSKKWFDFCFVNPEKVKPIHTALYFFAVEHCNRLGWKEKFGLPTEMAKEALGVKSWHTYIAAFNDIVDWGFFVVIERSKNQYSSNIIALSYFDKAIDEAYIKALTKHASKHQRSTHQSNDSIDKLINYITNNYKTIEMRFPELEKLVSDFVDSCKCVEIDLFPFDKFWDLYQKKTDKDKCAKKWKLLKNEEKQKAIEAIPKYVASTPDLKFRKNPLTWLNGKCWEDEITNEQTPKQPTQPLVKTPEQIFKENRKKLEDEQKARAEFKFDE